MHRPFVAVVIITWKRVSQECRGGGAAAAAEEDSNKCANCREDWTDSEGAEYEVRTITVSYDVYRSQCVNKSSWAL